VNLEFDCQMYFLWEREPVCSVWLTECEDLFPVDSCQSGLLPVAASSVCHLKSLALNADRNSGLSPAATESVGLKVGQLKSLNSWDRSQFC